VPGAVGIGERFSGKVGIKCEAGCRPDGWTLEVRDQSGEPVATVFPHDQPWPDTEGLFGNEVVLQAPESEGELRWEVVATGIESGARDSAEPETSHEEVRGTFGFRVLPRGDGWLTVVAVGRETQAPIAGASVVVHPHRTVTDDKGLARLELPAGRYRLFVTGPGFLPLRIEGELSGDDSIRAELEPDREPSDAELWS
jgi:hypothetical protein